MNSLMPNKHNFACDMHKNVFYKFYIMCDDIIVLHDVVVYEDICWQHALLSGAVVLTIGHDDDGGDDSGDELNDTGPILLTYMWFMKLLPLIGGVLVSMQNPSSGVATGNSVCNGDALCAFIDRSVWNEMKRRKIEKS